jgi:DNA polymerase-3 subunit epsilon
MEFKRLGTSFRPPLLCTVLLSRYLYPDYRHHKLQNLIDRFDFQTAHRHRAYDDAEVLWQFIQRIRTDFDQEAIETAFKRQLQPVPQSSE